MCLMDACIISDRDRIPTNVFAKSILAKFCRQTNKILDKNCVNFDKRKKIIV